MKSLEYLIVKFITGEASQEEIETLTRLLKNEKNKKIFKDFVRTNYLVDNAINYFDSDIAKNKLFRKISKVDEVKETIFLRFRSYLKYAAILVIILGCFFLYKKFSLQEVKNDNVIVPKENQIVLQVENESLHVINPTNSQNLKDKFGKIIGKQNKGKLVYSNSISDEKLVYNTLKIPYGKTFQVELSDGTIVYLNAGSTLRFPRHFLNKENRKVFLTGEAYFEVAKDKEHPFIVNTSGMDIKVLGTKFNVSAYSQDVTTNVVLVEGKVSLYKALKVVNRYVYLTPGLKGTVINGDDKISTEKVNTDYYTAWIKGSLVFKNESFNNIIKKLERRYSVTFINKNKILGKEIFNARFDNEPIETVLKYFSDSHAINYEIHKDTIIIR